MKFGWIGPLYEDPKHLEEFCFLKIIYKLFPAGIYSIREIYNKIEEDPDSINRLVEEIFGKPDSINKDALGDRLYDLHGGCVRLGLVQMRGAGSIRTNKVVIKLKDVDRVLRNPWRSKPMNIEGFLEQELFNNVRIDYYRDFLTEAKKKHGSNMKGMEEFFDLPNLIRPESYRDSVILTGLYNKGLVDVQGKLKSVNVNLLVPFKVRLKDELFGERVSEDIKNVGYKSKPWDGNPPDSLEEIKMLDFFYKIQPFSIKDLDKLGYGMSDKEARNIMFGLSKFYRRGYLERTNNYIIRNEEDRMAYHVYKVKSDLVKLISQ